MPLDTTKLRQLRERQGFTLDEAARRAGFAGRQRWYAIESGGKGKVTPDTLLALANALGVTMEELMSEPKKPRRR